MSEIAKCENKDGILTGDLYCNYLIPNDHKEIKDIVRTNGLKQITESTTRIKKTLIDNIALTGKTKISNSISDNDFTAIFNVKRIRTK